MNRFECRPPGSAQQAIAQLRANFGQPASRFVLVGKFVARRGHAVRVAVTGAGRVSFPRPS